MNQPHWTDVLRHPGTDDEDLRWARGYPDLRSAWAACTNPQQLLWLVGSVVRLNTEAHRRLVLCACEIARLVLRFTTDRRPGLAIEIAEAWVRGGPWPDAAAVRVVALDAAYTHTDVGTNAFAAASAVYYPYQVAHSAHPCGVWAAHALAIVRRYFPVPPDMPEVVTP